ncbi:hypothetical protein D3C74_279860 [compost metagenome]
MNFQNIIEIGYAFCFLNCLIKHGFKKFALFTARYNKQPLAHLCKLGLRDTSDPFEVFGMRHGYKLEQIFLAYRVQGIDSAVEWSGVG